MIKGGTMFRNIAIILFFCFTILVAQEAPERGQRGSGLES
jgi:hypothetical protein